METRDANGRCVSDIFMVLPSRRELPQYYQIIKKPIDLKKIKVIDTPIFCCIIVRNLWVHQNNLNYEAYKICPCSRIVY